MGKLCLTLPPFSPDYSGVCSTLFSFDALTVIHDASGCTGNYTGYDEPRWFHSRAPIYCSGLREIDAILGDDEKLVQKVLYALEDVKPEIIALVGSPVPMVIGADMEGIAAEIENRTGIMSFGFSTTGIGYYPIGIQMVYKKVIQRILEEDEKQFLEKENIDKNRSKIVEKEEQSNTKDENNIISEKEYSVNILGATPIDFGNSTTLKDLEQFLIENGLKINVSLWNETKKADIVKLKNADCNIVVSCAGVELAEYMEQKYQIPYVTGLPFGEQYSKIWLSELKQHIEKRKTLKVDLEQKVAFMNKEETIVQQKMTLMNEENNRAESKVLIIGEQFQSNSIRNAIEIEYSIHCDVAGICGWNEKFAKENDKFLESEQEIQTILNQENYDLIIGDSLYKGLLYNEKKFYEYSHYAVSSKLGNHKVKSLIQKNIQINFK